MRTALVVAWLSLFVGGIGYTPILAEPAAGTQQQETTGEIAIVVDDFGYFVNETVHGFLALDIPVTISVIPSLRYSSRIADAAWAADKEVMAHIPMEPIDYPAKNPGGSALFVKYDDAELRGRIVAALDSYPRFVGVNNHMGSRAMQDPRLLGILMKEIEGRGLFFVDSKTIPGERPRTIAKDHGVRFGENRLFWDTGLSTPDEIRTNLDRLAQIARRGGRAIAIGHPRAISLAILKEKLPELKKLGIRFVKVSDIVH